MRGQQHLVDGQPTGWVAPVDISQLPSHRRRQQQQRSLEGQGLGRMQRLLPLLLPLLVILLQALQLLLVLPLVHPLFLAPLLLPRLLLLRLRLLLCRGGVEDCKAPHRPALRPLRLVGLQQLRQQREQLGEARSGSVPDGCQAQAAQGCGEQQQGRRAHVHKGSRARKENTWLASSERPAPWGPAHSHCRLGAGALAPRSCYLTPAVHQQASPPHLVPPAARLHAAPSLSLSAARSAAHYHPP